MPRSLRVLITEDSSTDAELIVRELRRTGFDPDWQRVDTEAEYVAALRADLDIILCDYAMPYFSGLRALELLRESGLTIPFIVVSGAIGEDTAVAVMKKGAADFLLKDRLGRLGPAIENAMEQGKLRREREQAHAALRESERRERERAAELEAILDAVPTPVFIAHEPDCRHITGNRAGDELLRHSRGAEASLSAVGENRPRHFRALKDGCELRNEDLPAQRAARGIPVKDFDFSLAFDDGTARHVVGYGVPLRDDSGKPRGAINVLVDITERKRAEEVLKAREAQLHSFVQQAPAAIAMFDRNMNYLAASQRWVSDYGRGRSKLVGLNHYVVHPDVPEHWKEFHRQALSGAAHSIDEELWPQADGSIVWLRWSVTPWLDAQGNIGGVMILAEDISRRKRAEEALRRSEEQYRQLVQALPTAVYTCDAEGRILLYNAAAASLWGREPKIGQDRWCGSHRIFDPEGRRVPPARCPMALAIKQGEAIRGAELIVERPDGSRSYVLAFPEPIRDASGAVAGAVNMLVDITALKATESALISSEKNLRVLSRAVEQSPASVLITNPSGRIEYVNPAFTEVTGYAVEEVLGRNPRLLKSGLQSREFYQQMWETITAGQDWRGEFCNRKKNGELYWVYAVIAPILDEYGAITHFVELKEDITERKRLEAELLEVSAREQRRIGQDLHDDLCQWLAGTEFLATALARDLDSISAVSAERARKIGECMREALSRTRTLARGLSPAVIESEGLVAALRGLAASASETFQIRCFYEGPEVIKARDEIAALHLYRIAQEAISNAVRHGKAGEVRVIVSSKDDSVSMVIRDDGCGLPQPLPQTSGMGLRTMRYRAGVVGATLEIRPGGAGGTEVVCVFAKQR